MKILVLGAGKVGTTIIEALSQENHEIKVIDKKQDVLDSLANRLDVLCLQGDGIQYSTLADAGAEETDVLIAVASRDETNMLSCIIGKKAGVKHTIARVRNPDFFSQMLYMKQDLGMEMIINPELAAADEIARVIRIPSALKVETFSRGRVELIEMKLKEGNPLNHSQLSTLYSAFGVKVLICTVERNGNIMIPDGSFVLEQGDRITITASREELAEFLRLLGLSRSKMKNVLIIGGGRISVYLARQLEFMRCQTTIVEMNEERCLELSDLLPHATIIHGDGTDPEVLHEAGFNCCDAAVLLSSMDEENFVLAMYAETFDTPKIICKINRDSYASILQKALPEATIISPKNITAEEIIQQIRARQNASGSHVETLYKLVSGKAEALEFTIRKASGHLNIPLQDLPLKSGILIACILRNGRPLIPNGQSWLQLNDHVIVVTTNSNYDDLEDCFD